MGGKAVEVNEVLHYVLVLTHVQILKITFAFALTTSTTADETACTREPRLRPGCCLHAVSSSYVIVACGPLTPWLCTAMYSPCSTLLRPGPPWVPSSQGIVILASATNPLSPMSPEGVRPVPRPSIHASPCGHHA